ncbi:hypothetical protein SAMN04488103_103198 [Gemmobacter aquatilis]|uniref:Uncharacterized protein n=1 Tax=Gemmobacter aquatilis TaxID=933059 RepID=A0A1H8E2F6_9RHOB|nr:hypothetical protein SAMN04488103_103198 [Gemmobacter aquatilis]
MPKRNWLRKGWSVIIYYLSLALQVLVLPIILLISAYLSYLCYTGSVEQSAIEDESKLRSKSSFNAIYQAEWQRCSGLTIAERKDCRIDTEEAIRENELKEHDLVAQEVTALWTRITGLAAILGALSGLLGLGLIWAAYKESRETNKGSREANAITREIGQAQVRAYLSIKTATYTRDSDGTSKIALEFINTGQSPASDIEVIVTADLKDEVNKNSITTPLNVDIWKPGAVAAREIISGVFAVLPPAHSDNKTTISYEVTIMFRTVFDDLGVRVLKVSGSRNLANIRHVSCGRLELPREHAAEHKVETAQPPQPLLPPAASAT